MAQNHVLLETIHLNEQVGSVVFDNIPQTGYTDLKILFSGLGNGTEGVYLRFNASSVNFAGVYVYTDGTTASTGSSARYLGSITAATTSPNSGEIYISNYTSSASKPFVVHEAAEANSSTGFVNTTQGVWSNSAAITSVTIEAAAGLRANSTFSIYGIAALGTTPVTAPFASGGSVVANDGTYWYHAFLSSGIFAPTKALTCDVLVVGGGGGGGSWTGGGGGAGGLLAYTSQSLTEINYAVTVGAGGAGGSYFGPPRGVNGSSSQFASLTASAGGGGGGGFNGTYYTALAGGSGGGGTTDQPGGGAQTGGAASPSGQGNAGGSYTRDSSYAAAGGGGAGAVGANNSGTTAGSGGVGVSTYSSWGLATTTGQNSGGTVYYAGGGGGGSNGAGSRSSGGLGGGGAGRVSFGETPDNGLLGTGGGGGGGPTGSGSTAATGGTGGSGVVIIRYPMV